MNALQELGITKRPFLDDNKWTNKKWEISLLAVLDARNKQVQKTF
jgi:hypothetical protein